MANYSLAELTTRMQGKSITLGWDAVVFMNRAKVNSLLEQQYITRFNQHSFLKRISGVCPMTPDGEELLELSGVILSHPRLSFEKASLRDSRVTATMDIVSGTVSYVRKGNNQIPAAVLRSYVVSAHQGHTLTMDIDLAGSTGSVNEQGKVILDIGDAYNCRCNLVNEDKSQELLGDFFKALFLEQKPEDRVYTLGMLDLRDVDLLAPRSFKIRTMATDEGKIRTSDDYGEGAVVLMVRTKGNSKEGDEPTETSLDYLIPNDRDAQGKAKYSGSLVLASRAVFDWYFQDPIQNMIGHGVRFERMTESNNIARSLRAVSGELPLPGYFHRWADFVTHIEEVYNVGEHKLSFSGIDVDALKIVAGADNALEATWTGEQKQRFEVWIRDLWVNDKYPSDAEVTYDVKIKFDPVVGPLNVLTFQARTPQVSFNSNYDAVTASYINIEFIQRFIKVFLPQVNSTLNEYTSFFRDTAIFKSFGIPEINTLAISNLIFPELNALQLTDARLPGDLALYGQIDPKETTFTLDPLMPVVKADQKQVFTIRQLGYRAADVIWGVRSVDGARATGTIVNGEYTAPAAQLLEGTAARNVVTATYTDPATGNEVTASALVTVALSGVVVTPSMSLIEMEDRKSVTLKATTLGAGPIRWTAKGGPGTLIPNGNEAIYTPPQTNLPDGALQVAEFDVEDTSTGEKTTATVLLRQGNFALNISPAFVPGLRPSSSALLKVPNNLRPDQFKWEVVAGQGSINPTTGVFTAPTNITSPYSVVKVVHEGDFFDTVGYSIIYLSEHARASSWLALDTFDFAVDPVPTRVYANGLQQAKVVVRVRPAVYDGGPAAPELSDREYESISLVSANDKNPLPEVGAGGVPVGDKWHVTETENDYRKYQETAVSQEANPDQKKAGRLHTKEFFVQCHKVESLMVAARIRNDNNYPFYSNPSPEDGEGNNKARQLIAIQPPEGGTIGQVVFTFGDNPPVRVKGDKDDEVDLETIDYYFLKLMIRGVQLGIRHVEFVGNTSMLKWESNTQLEDVHSITGYAVPDVKNGDGKQILHIDGILLRRMDGNIPDPIVDPGHPVPAGQVLFSLHRRQYWQYDQYAKSDFDSALNLIVYDDYGNRHTVAIGFDGNNRNKLRIIGS
ncbi:MULTISPECIES: hypothetical protein [unclassified Pseudomonas]|uniref:hypothetical protein n=1 Tax=unclassified Pseudomonas TaxID=196821 RepID=UPI000C87E8F7|nr:MULTISPECIES: hypothetical protein [unclassified Pseudomonas]PMZ89970.1 hypothetical protein C1X61_09400 [Pseudomonas sp. FW215-T2]PNA12510.1 hypothetical protein C1X62_12335 [Pseudomonas sp. FW215-R3]PNB32522.1 hypothetical protein C1X63_29685 [Pseudomonas sp. FW305-131]